MNEVENMHRNAGVKKPQMNECTSDNCPFNWKYGICQTKKCPYWETKQSEYYPPFTAEKQLELIKWCLDRYGGYILDRIVEIEKFEEQLCKLINDHWECLTEQERMDIKTILES